MKIITRGLCLKCHKCLYTLMNRLIFFSKHFKQDISKTLTAISVLTSLEFKLWLDKSGLDTALTMKVIFYAVLSNECDVGLQKPKR